MGGFHRTFPKKEKLIDIGFLTVGFSKGTLDNFFLDGFSFFRYWTDRMLVLVWLFAGYWIIYINQLLTQN